MEGWVAVHRKLREWEWYQDSEMVHVFIHMLLRANRYEKPWEGIMLKPGQFASGRKKIAAETGISEQTVRTCIKRLISTKEITIKSTNRYTIYTIVNWKAYQPQLKETNQQNNQVSNQQLTSNQPATNQQLTTNNKEKKVKNIEEGEEKRTPPTPPGGESGDDNFPHFLKTIKELPEVIRRNMIIDETELANRYPNWLKVLPHDRLISKLYTMDDYLDRHRKKTYKKVHLSFNTYVKPEKDYSEPEPIIEKAHICSKCGKSADIQIGLTWYCGEHNPDREHGENAVPCPKEVGEVFSNLTDSLRSA